MFFILPVGVDYQARRYPVVTFTLMGICMVVYLVTLALRLTGNEVDEWVFANLWLIPAQSHWWTFLTSLFCHAGLFHLLGNMVYLFLFGSCVEDQLGRIRFTFFYLLAGVVSCFVHILGSPAHFASEIPLGGASGAISGCIGAFVLVLGKRHIEFKWVFFLFFTLRAGEFHLRAWVVITFWFACDLVSAVLTATLEQESGVAFAAHVGGFVAGMAWMALERPRLRREAEAEETAEREDHPAVARLRTAPQSVRAPVRVQVAEQPTIHLHIAGKQYGPYSLAQIQQWLHEQQVAADALYWQEGMADWRPVEELREPGQG